MTFALHRRGGNRTELRNEKHLTVARVVHIGGQLASESPSLLSISKYEFREV